MPAANHLVTGPPRSGKTTTLDRVRDRLSATARGYSPLRCASTAPASGFDPADNGHGDEQSTDIEDRTRRALTETLTVLMPDGTPVENPSRTSFSVTSASGATYQADLASGSCDCADAEYRPLAGTSTFAVTFETDSVVVEIGDRCLVLDATSLPESGVVMGFGYVGIELVSYLAEADIDVTVVEHDARPLDDAPPAFGDELLSLYREAFDVEVVRDGRYATGSLRNHDRVVFINRSSGEVNESLSLGADDDHSILGEQHNADYIPDERGGPATIVADSNNDRIVESQREDGE